MLSIGDQYPFRVLLTTLVLYCDPLTSQCHVTHEPSLSQDIPLGSTRSFQAFDADAIDIIVVWWVWIDASRRGDAVAVGRAILVEHGAVRPTSSITVRGQCGTCGVVKSCAGMISCIACYT